MANNARRSNANSQSTAPQDAAQLSTADVSSGLPRPKLILPTERSSRANVKGEVEAAKMGSFRKAFPSIGQPWAALKGRMEAMRSDDVQWRHRGVPLHVYFAGEDVLEVASEAYTMFMSENALAPSAFPSLGRGWSVTSSTRPSSFSTAQPARPERSRLAVPKASFSRSKLRAIGHA